MYNEFFIILYNIHKIDELDCCQIIILIFAEFFPLIYPPELEVKETTDTASSASFLDLYLEFDDSGELSTKFMINGTTSILKS